MAAPKDPVQTKYRKCLKLFANVDPAAVKLVESTIYDCCWYSIRIRELQDEINLVGSVVDTPHGDKPSAQSNVMHTYMSDKNACLKTLIPLFAKTPAGKAQKDEFMDFLKS